MLQEFYTVGELNELIREVITRGIPQSVWVCGEIQGYNRNRDKKHIFFELCEKDPVSHEVMARSGLVIFFGRKVFIEEKLKEAQNAFELKDDIEVKFLCQVDFYPPHGAVRLVVETIDPIYTLGKIAQERQKLIAELKAKGILDKNKVLELPTVPLRIGLITAFDSAAYNDFISELKRSGFGFQVSFMNTLMQGKKAQQAVCRALSTFNRRDDLDVVVITRGGGSIADLSCFDSRMIAEKIAESRVPVLSGIGHEINITVTDLAAHTYEKTPTAIARFLAQRVQDFLAGMDVTADKLFQVVWDRIDEQSGLLKDYAVNLQNRMRDYMQVHQHRLVSLYEVIRRRPGYSLQEETKNLIRRQDDLFCACRLRVQTAHTALKNYEKFVEIASPLKTLRRGFTITRTSGGKVLKGIQDANPQEEIVTELADGSLTSVVRQRQKGGNVGGDQV